MNQSGPIDYNGTQYQCPLCGWRYHSATWISEERWATVSTYTILREFDLNASQVSLHELGGYLKRNFSDVYGLSPRRFEELTADVFRAHGFRIILTQATRDGGADLLLLKHESQADLAAIVECKRYARERRIGVSLVRTLVGAAVAWDVRRAYLVTTSDFSSDAWKSATDYRGFGYEIELVGCSELLSMLNVYNPDLPRLECLTPQLREEIIAANRKRQDALSDGDRSD